MEGIQKPLYNCGSSLSLLSRLNIILSKWCLDDTRGGSSGGDDGDGSGEFCQWTVNISKVINQSLNILGIEGADNRMLEHWDLSSHLECI